MNPEITGVLITLFLTILLAIPLGKYIAGVFDYKPDSLSNVFGFVDKLFYKLSGIDPQRRMDWKQNLSALLTINLVWFVLTMLVLTNMANLPLNPDGNPSMSADLAFNTAVSFITNTNLQHYSGESGLSYFGQMTLMLWQFISASSGLAICGLLFKAMQSGTDKQGGNFYTFFVRSSTRILFPLALLFALFYVFNGVPMTFAGKAETITLQGDTQMVSRGPVAAFLAIKQLGTNGGGFYGVNSAHPLENPDYLTNIAEEISILLVPMALVLAMGHVLKRKKLSYMIFGVMFVFLSIFLITTISLEMGGNPAIAKMGIAQHMGSMEGKEVRFGAATSGYWAVATTSTSNGSVNAMHDSLTPLSGMIAMLGMMLNCVFGGVGVGFLNFYVFIILAVFVSGLMVGRTPEFLGKKIEAREMKIAMIIALLHPFLILEGTAISSFLISSDPASYGSWLANPGFHGFSEMLYEFTSSSANNGSGFEGLGDNTMFWNLACGIVMLLARYLPIIGPFAIASLLAKKQYVPDSAGTLKTDSATFAVMVFSVIVIVAALSFFPALVMGPIGEFFSMMH